LEGDLSEKRRPLEFRGWGLLKVAEEKEKQV